MIIEVDIRKFNVEKQAEPWLCWAASARAIAQYHGLAAPDQQGLGAMFPDKTQGASPKMVLESKFSMKEHVLWQEDRHASEDAVNRSREQDLRDNLRYHLGAKSGPFLCGITEQQDTAWPLTGRSKPYTYRHATLIYRFNTDTDEVGIADPARSDERGRTITVRIPELIRGFRYIEKADLGPNAASLLPAAIGDISVRAYRLSWFEVQKA